MQTTYKPTADDVKRLRDETGAGMIDCRNALVKADGNTDKAKELLQEQGQSKAEKKAERSANEGLVGSYIHTGGKVGVLVEINCETDFVARNESFRSFVKDVTLQVAAAAPLYVKRDEVPQSLIDVERDIASATLKKGDKMPPADKLEQILKGKLDKYYSTVCLLEQSFVKDNTKPINDLLAAKIAELGENIIIRRFTRFQVGESLGAQPAAPAETPAA